MTARCCTCWRAERGVKGRGMELSQAGVNACVTKGLAVVQGDADRDLKGLSRSGVRLHHSVQDHPGRAPSALCAERTGCASASA
ncbi:MAG: methionine biosynthesis protein MetW [Terricaulis sp.]